MSSFLCAVPEGDDIASKVISALTKCEMVIIMGSKTYGMETKSRYSTFQELRFIDDERKAFFLVKMCDKFEIPETRFRLNDSIAYIMWKPGTRKIILYILIFIYIYILYIYIYTYIYIYSIY